jgi:hypothetical protein
MSFLEYESRRSNVDKEDVLSESGIPGGGNRLGVGKRRK